MSGFWKIDKKWVQEWGLTGNEALLLADLLDWECGMKDRAQRLGVTRQRLYTTLERLTEKMSQNVTQECHKMLQRVSQNVTPKCHKMLHNDVTKCDTVSIIGEHIEEHKEEREEAHTHTREDEREALGEVETVEKLAGEFRSELEAGSMTAERFQRSYGLMPEQVEQALRLFEDKLAIEGVTVKSRGDFRRHFNNWLKNNAKTIFNDGNNNSSHKYQSKYSAEYMAGIVADITSGE